MANTGGFRSRVVVAACLLVVISVSLPVASHADSAAEVQVSLSAERNSATSIAYTLHLDFGTNVDSVRLVPGRPTRTTFHGTDAATPKVSDSGSIRIGYNISGTIKEQCRCIATTQWAIVQPLPLKLEVSTDEGRSYVSLVNMDPAIDLDGTGHATAGFIYFGEHSVRRGLTVTKTEFVVVLPETSRRRVNATEVLGHLRFASSVLDVGTPERSSFPLLIRPQVGSGTEVVVNDWLGGEGGARQRFLYVRDSAGLRTFFHEYVHHREQFRTQRDSRWLREGLAAYLELLLMVRSGEMSTEAFRNELNRNPVTYPGGNLSEPSTWASPGTQYEKGAVVLAYLDQRIREETDGTRTLIDVFARLNGREFVSHRSLTDTVAAVVGDDRLEEEIDRYVTTDANPADYEYLYVLGEDPGITVTPPPTASPTVTPTLTKGAPPGSTESSTPTSQPSSGHPTSAGANDRDPAGGTTPGMGIAVTVVVLLGTVFLLRKGTLNWGD